MKAPATVEISDDNLVRTCPYSSRAPERFDGGLVNDLADALSEAAAFPGCRRVRPLREWTRFQHRWGLKALALPEPVADGDGGNGFDRLLDALADFPSRC